MKRMQTLQILAGMLLAVIGLMPSTADAALTWLNDVTVTRVYMFAQGRFAISVSTQAPTCDNGSTPKLHYVQVGTEGMTAEAFKNMYASALTALATGNLVRIYWNDATNSCYIENMQLVSEVLRGQGLEQ